MEEEFWPDYVSEELKNSTTVISTDVGDLTTYNIICLDSEYLNRIISGNVSEEQPNSFAIYVYEGSIILGVWNESAEIINMENYTNYADLTFTISMAE